MTHDEMNFRTKQMLADSLKKYMEKKPLNKITVTDIADDCNVNRKTFYYHFDDIYMLLKWMLEQEAVNVVKQYDLTAGYRDVILFVIDYVESNAYILNCAYDSMGREGMKQFFYADFYNIIESVINDMENQLNLHAGEDFKAYLCSFYTEAITGRLISLFKDDAPRDKHKIVDYFYFIMQSSLPVLLEMSQKQKNLGE